MRCASVRRTPKVAWLSSATVWTTAIENLLRTSVARPAGSRRPSDRGVGRQWIGDQCPRIVHGLSTDQSKSSVTRRPRDDTTSRESPGQATSCGHSTTRDERCSWPGGKASRSTRLHASSPQLRSSRKLVGVRSNAFLGLTEKGVPRLQPVGDASMMRARAPAVLRERVGAVSTSGRCACRRARRIDRAGHAVAVNVDVSGRLLRLRLRLRLHLLLLLRTTDPGEEWTCGGAVGLGGGALVVGGAAATAARHRSMSRHCLDIPTRVWASLRPSASQFVRSVATVRPASSHIASSNVLPV